MLSVRFDLPPFTETDAAALAREIYGLNAAAVPLPGEKDRNFLLAAADGGRYVLKIANAETARETLELENAAMTHLAAQGVEGVQRVLPALDGRAVAQAGGHSVRLLTYFPGRLWTEVSPHTPEMRAALGTLLGGVDRALSTFDHPAARREIKWDLARASWIRDYLAHIEDEARRALVERRLTQFESEIRPRLACLRRSVIHNDANDYNLIVDGNAVRLIDFGDMVYTHTISELAVACAYAMLGKPDPLAAAAEIVRAYHREYPLEEAELELLFPLIAMRLAVSVANSAYQRTAAADNGYLLVSERPAWALLEKVESIRPEYAHYTFRAACGFPAVPQTPRVAEWLRGHAAEIGRVVEPGLGDAIAIDWSVGSLDLGNPSDYEDTARLTRAIRARMAEAGVKAAIGRYDEPRPLYAGAAYRMPANDGCEWRTVHIGLDIFVDAGSPVFAPLDGTVHSFANNAARYDYGPCIVLEHEPAPGLRFWTLYGHLSPDSLDGLCEGKPVRKGERIASIGNYPGNGGWPPHLHLGIITDMLGYRGDYPGSCRPSQREVWLSLCPDPNLIAQVPPERLAVRALDADQILERRRASLGYNLSLSYRKPLHVVRGYRQWLYDAWGQRYLDAVNNVPHVGHCHPKVVRAGQRQMAVLNTNTRYLHENIVRYAQRISATLPEPLRVCFFVNSGSEANELALRLARAHTGRKDMLVLAGAYHGNTTGAIDVSPYKYAHKGGSGAPQWVRELPMPDPYRNPFGCDIRHAAAALANGPASFLAEPILSCGGQLMPPANYFREVYWLVRATGGVCIADEVQTGFGRSGSHFWAFQMHDVVPDIVTMGKPAGNGHPLGIVVTRPEIAASFNNGLEYFNTFGGNPVSCAIGLAVLDVIEEEGLQRNALETGKRLIEGLRALACKHAIIGDVRGAGLFLGFELVRDRRTLEPAAAEAGYLVNRMKEHGVLLSTDGPLENVIKIKPPLCFGLSDADYLIETLDKVLREDFLRK
jgi:4-aminobutyrate aminotransferase-like enzyme/Ser/Thr protein kinase RdoA (MazF antagonist)